MKLKAKDISAVIEEYNPFGFKDAKGRIMLFRSYTEAYFELINRVYAAGPKMVDVVLFIVDNLGMTLTDAKKFFARWRGCCGATDAVFLFDWKNGGKDRDKSLEKICRGMHLISETKFNNDMFLCALNNFKCLIKVNN